LTEIKDLTRCRKRAAKILEGLGMEWGVCALHPVGDESPEWAPHWNFLWVPRAGVSPHLSKSKLEKLKEAWREALDLRPTDPIDVNHRYYKLDKGITAVINHKLRYYLRPFPGWGSVLKLRIVPYGKYPKVTATPTVCADCGRPWKAWGYCSGVEFYEWFHRGRLHGLDPPVRRFRRTSPKASAASVEGG